MTLSLDPILAAAQDDLKRSPIIELISTQPNPAIPLDGEYFNASDTAEIGPDIISHSSGRMVSAHIRDGDNIVILLTNIDKTVWTETVIDVNSYAFLDMAICELSNGNIGIICIDVLNSIKYMVIAISDTQVTIINGLTEIVDYDSPNSVNSPFVIRLQDGSFLLVYSHYDGTNYSIYKQASSDFISWNAAANITLSGFELTYSSDHPSLIQVASGDIFLFLDHVTDESNDATITDIFKLISSDNGVTWDVPEQLTSYTAWGSGGIHPYPALTADNQIKLAFHETNSILFMSSSTDFWQNDCSNPQYSTGASIHYDPATKRLYVKQIYTNGGIKSLCGIVVIDVDTWTVIRNYNTGTTPAYSSLFLNEHVWYGSQKHHSEGKYVAISTSGHLDMATMVIDDEAETITTYVFKTEEAYADIKVNVTGWPGTDDATTLWKEQSTISGTWIDENTNRVYLLIQCGYLYQPYIVVGYIDLTGVKDPATGMYTFVKILWDDTSWESSTMGMGGGNGGILVEPGIDRFFLYGTGLCRPKLIAYDLSNGAIIAEYQQSNAMKSFPYHGFGNCVYKDNHLYGHTEYHSADGQDIYRGLCDLDLDSGSIKYHRPSYATVDQYDFAGGVVLDSDRIAFAAPEYGIAIYNIIDDSWSLYNDDSIPGFEPSSFNPNPVSIAYNSTDKIIYIGSIAKWGYGNWGGIRAVSESGSFDQGQYMVGILGADWSFGAQADLSIGLTDYDFAVAIDNEGILWAQWVRKDISYLSIKWDKDQADLDLEPYLINGVGVAYDIANVASLSFSLSHGHLFDQNNSLSALKIFVKKGRPVTLRFGEKVDGIDYWQNQGTYYIKNTSITYVRGSYPEISLVCEDRLSLLERVKVTVSEYYSDQYPEIILEDVIAQFTNLSIDEISIDDFDTRHKLWYQITDESLVSAIKKVLDHFGYFICMDVDKIMTTRKVKTSVDSVDHVYSSDMDKIISFSPDDNYTDFTNRVIVTSESRELVEVLYAEALITAVTGSCGWWESGTIYETVYFNDAHTKKCRNIRLHIKKSIKDFKILWMKSKGTESISYYDTGELYIIIKIECPSLQSVLIGMLIAVLVVGYAASGCGIFDPCGKYILATTVLVSAIGYVLGQVATYDYEVYGRAVGEEKQTIQAQADDTGFQNDLDGLVVTAEIDDALCYTVEVCKEVAEYELEVVKAQRNRVSFSKITHLQDEIGDIIQIKHPYSGKELNIFITRLSRQFTFGESGCFVDKIEGWSL